MRGRGLRHLLLLCALMSLGELATPVPAHASMGPPILVYSQQIARLLLLEAAIVALETPVLKRFLKLPLKMALVAALAANAITTLLGMALVNWWNDFVYFNLWPVTEGWFGIHSDKVNLLCDVAAFFAVSFSVEWLVVTLITRAAWQRAGLAVAAANAVTHVGLLLLALPGVW